MVAYVLSLCPMHLTLKQNPTLSEIPFKNQHVISNNMTFLTLYLPVVLKHWYTAKQVNGIATHTLFFFQNCFLCAVRNSANRTDTNETVFE